MILENRRSWRPPHLRLSWLQLTPPLVYGNHEGDGDAEDSDNATDQGDNNPTHAIVEEKP
jgi:hypothetical protein